MRVRTFVLRFAMAFLLLEAFVYFVLWHARWFTPYAEVNAYLTAVLLGPFLEGARASGEHLVSPTFSILVRPGCDSYQASAVLLAGIAAFPAALGRKLLGALVGVGCLMLLNLARLGALLWTGVHHRERFELMHLEVLPAVFVGASLLLLLGWALWARE
jgi:exosortase/archaeosortase family protein